MENQNLQFQILENRVRRQGFWLKFSFIGWVLSIGVVSMPAWFWTSQAQQSVTQSSLRVSELVVVDPNGVERVRIGGDLPDAVIGGKQIRRGEKVAGVMLYDGTGQERSGYVTFEPSGNVGLTLDTRKGQVGYLIADPDSGSAMRLWHNKDLVELRSDSEGSRLTTVKDGQVILQQPQIIKMSTSACGAYQSASKQLTKEQLISECRQRYSKTACEVCLGKLK